MRTRAIAVACSLLTSCTSPVAVGLRPDGSPSPEPCSKKALEAMAILRLHPGDAAWIDLDLNQRGEESIIVNDGPVESALQEPIGPVLEGGTRLYGRIWTGGPNVVIRYYEARPLDPGVPVAICAVARLDGELHKKPGPAPGSAILPYSIARAYIVDEFR